MASESVVGRAIARAVAWPGLPAWALGVGFVTLGLFELLPCPFAALLSLPCPGCGLSRAARELLAGDVRAALALHPLSPLVLPLTLAGLTWALGAPRVRSTLHSAALSGLVLQGANVASVVLVVLLLGVWIARFFGAFGGPVPVY